jgi:hypothetical protein
MLPRELAANWLVAAVLDHCAGSSGNPGPWWPTRLARALPPPFNFETAWRVCFQHFAGDDRVYAVSCLDASQGHAPTWLVRIGSSFSRWAVREIQAARGATHAPWNYNSGILAPSGEASIATLLPARRILRPSLKQIVRFSMV